MPAVYAELRRVARAYMRRERPDHTLQPTALVHEALLRLDGTIPLAHGAHPAAGSAVPADPGAFLALAARAMRRVLVDHARRRSAAKRQLLSDTDLDHAYDPAGERGALDLLALDDALAQLAAVSPRAARVVELRFFAGLDVEAVARALGIGPATVKRDWSLARAWLRRALDERALDGRVRDDVAARPEP